MLIEEKEYHIGDKMMMFDEIFEGIKKISGQEIVEEKEWFIYIPKQGLALINYTGNSKEEAEAVYLERSGDESLPLGSKVYDEEEVEEFALPDESEEIEKFDVTKLNIEDFQVAAKKYGVDLKFLGKKFAGFGSTYKLVGVDDKYRDAPFVAIQNRTGVDYRFSADDVIRAFTGDLNSKI